ncbi:MAG TPA: MBL fold metallo-hydrolase [Opitutaceae bacterium]
MNRRSFLVKSSVAVSAGLLSRSLLRAQTPPAAPAGGPPAPAPYQTTFTPLRRNVGLFTGRGGTIGWLANSTALAAVDTQFPDAAQRFLDEFPNRGGRQFDLLINSHHHGDHVGGNPVFRPVTKSIVAHANVPDLMKAAGARANPPQTNFVLPDATFTDTWRKELGDEIVSAKYYGAAHTKGDIVVTFERANVVHMGDLMFNRVYPVMDRPGGASTKGWISVMEKAVADHDADTIYIAGHSAANNPQFTVKCTRADLLVFRDYLAAMLAHVEKEIKAGKTKEEIVVLQNLPGFTDFHVERGSRLPGNLGATYDELTTPSA